MVSGTALRVCVVEAALVFTTFAGALSGCAGPSPSVRAASLLPRRPAELGRCQVAASQSSPLVTEWPASEKANLEVLLRGGAVAVAFSGCSLRVLPECRVKGAYRWTRTTPSTDSLEINDADELYAKLPVGAASLEGELKRSGKLSVQTTVAGELRIDGASVADVPQDAACAQATHLVSALSLGAFALKAGGTRSGEAGVKLGVADAGLKREASAELLRSAGEFDSCSAGTQEGPSANCASPIQVFLAPLPGRTEQDGPPGTVKVDFVSANPAGRWDVYADDKVICTTPCAEWVAADRPILLRAREEAFLQAPDKVQVPNLLAHSGEARLQLQAHPTARGELAAGIVFASFAGMAAITGITLTSVGCLADHSGFCTPGLITLGVSAPLVVGSIWMILDSMPRAEVVSPEAMTLVRAERPRLLFGPGFVSGRF
jgi:hypothetical protein